MRCSDEASDEQPNINITKKGDPNLCTINPTVPQMTKSEGPSIKKLIVNQTRDPYYRKATTHVGMGRYELNVDQNDQSLKKKDFWQRIEGAADIAHETHFPFRTLSNNCCRAGSATRIR